MSAQRKWGPEGSYLLPGGGDVTLRYPHPPLAQSQETSLRTYSLNVCTREVVLRSDKLLQIDIVRKGHS